MKIWYLTPQGFKFDPTPPFYFMDFYKSRYIHKLYSIPYDTVYVNKTVLPLPMSAYLKQINEIYPDFENGLEGTFPVRLININDQEPIHVRHITDLFEVIDVPPDACIDYLLNDESLPVPAHIVSFAKKTYQSKIVKQLPDEFDIPYDRFPLLYALLMRTNVPYIIEPNNNITIIHVKLGHQSEPYHKHVKHSSVILPMRSGYYNGAQVSVKSRR